MNWSIVMNVVLVILVVLIAILGILYYLGRKQHESGDAGCGAGEEHHHQPDQRRPRHVSCPQSGSDAERDLTDVRRSEEVPGAWTVSGCSYESGGASAFLSVDRTVLPGRICALI